MNLDHRIRSIVSRSLPLVSTAKHSSQVVSPAHRPCRSPQSLHSQPTRLPLQHCDLSIFLRNERPNLAEYLGEQPEMSFSRRGITEGQNKKRKLSL